MEIRNVTVVFDNSTITLSLEENDYSIKVEKIIENKLPNEDGKHSVDVLANETKQRFYDIQRIEYVKNQKG